jgi:hypothetical protein
MRALLALALGVLGAAAASGACYGAEAIEGVPVRWIAVISGLLVGAGVRVGTGPRGGMASQALAIFLTYGAIVSTYGRDIREALEQASLSDEKPAPKISLAAASGLKKKQPSWETLSTPQRVVVVAVTSAVVTGLIITAPFLGEDALIELAVVGVALLSAWKLTHRRGALASGPLEVALKHGQH